MSISYKEIQKAPKKSGIYALLNNNEIVYIGRSTNCYQRILEHCAENKKEFNSVSYFIEDLSDPFLDILEVGVIYSLKPKYNKLVIQDLWTYFNCLPYIIRSDIRNDYSIFKDMINICISILGLKK